MGAAAQATEESPRWASANGEKTIQGEQSIFFTPLKFCLTLSHPYITRKEIPMEQIPDDPIIAAMLRTGWPPWMLTAGADGDGLDQD